MYPDVKNFRPEKKKKKEIFVETLRSHNDNKVGELTFCPGEVAIECRV